MLAGQHADTQLS